MRQGRKILLSLDIEEFDLPVEYGIDVPIKDQLNTGLKGLHELAPLLTDNNKHFTLFTTAFFAENFPGEIRALSKNHEIASHTYYHNRFEPCHLEKSKIMLESITGQPVYGLRMPRLKAIDSAIIRQAGYLYDSSINPTLIPGRYNNLFSIRTLFSENGLNRLPVSVTPRIRIPLFWLAFKNMPYNIFLKLALRTLEHDGYVSLYFHPWEFTDLSAYKIPGYIKRGSNGKLIAKFTRLVKDLSGEGDFEKINEFITARNISLSGSPINALT